MRRKLQMSAVVIVEDERDVTNQEYANEVVQALRDAIDVHSSNLIDLRFDVKVENAEEVD